VKRGRGRHGIEKAPNETPALVAFTGTGGAVCTGTGGAGATPSVEQPGGRGFKPRL
jgi:hypothetical protein